MKRIPHICFGARCGCQSVYQPPVQLGDLRKQSMPLTVDWFDVVVFAAVWVVIISWALNL